MADIIVAVVAQHRCIRHERLETILLASLERHIPIVLVELTEEHSLGLPSQDNASAMQLVNLLTVRNRTNVQVIYTTKSFLSTVWLFG